MSEQTLFDIPARVKTTSDRGRLRVDLVGRIFGKRTVIGLAEKARGGHRRYHVLCNCGREGIAFEKDLLNGRSQSCANCRSITHGRTGTRTYGTWLGMIGRCSPSNSKCSSHKWYAGKGISVCERWSGSNGFKNFLADMGEVPPNMSIDRIDGTKGYEPQNCRWATATQQSRNTSRNHYVEFGGQRKLVVEWSEHLGIPSETIHARLRMGWPLERVFTKKNFRGNPRSTEKKNRILTFGGESLTLTQWAKRVGLNVDTLCSRINKHGMSIERALTQPKRAWNHRKAVSA